jgi:prevent-host-death family protein
MYNTYMSATEPLNISEARSQLAAIVDLARAEHRPVFLTRRGHRIAAVIDADDLDRIVALAEDMADIRAAEGARAEMKATGEAPIPWDEVKAELGLA